MAPGPLAERDQLGGGGRVQADHDDAEVGLHDHPGPGGFGPLPSVVLAAEVAVEPGEPDDYFASDVVRLSGLEPPDYSKPSSPRTSYYRFGADCELDRAGRTTGPHKALVTAVIMPLHEPLRLNRERVEYWLRQLDIGIPLTAFGVAVIDNQQPAMSPADDSYPDGHSRFRCCLDPMMAVQ